ncbi:unnamed protein product [Ascophyllum nodosum]
MAKHNTPPPKVPVPPHGGQQHSMVLPLPRPQVPPQHPVKTNSPSSPSPRHVTGQDVGMRTHESGFLGRQASEMEEDVLPPVVKQEHSPPTAMVNGDSALPKRERRQRFRSRGPPPPPPFSPRFSPGPSGGGEWLYDMSTAQPFAHHALPAAGATTFSISTPISTSYAVAGRARICTSGSLPEPASPRHAPEPTTRRVNERGLCQWMGLSTPRAARGAVRTEPVVPAQYIRPADAPGSSARAQ